VGIRDWINSEPLDLAALRGRVVLLDFWTYSCINCQRTIPYLAEWDTRYRDKGLTIIGVHSPEFAFERRVSNVAQNARRLGVRYPVAIDNDFRTWREWDQRYWPAHYLIDQSGRVRQVHYGEGAYDDTERLIAELLSQPPGGAGADGPAHTIGRTPETYLGHLRARSVVNLRPEFFGVEAQYRGEDVRRDEVTLDGRWTVDGERIVAGDGASLALRYYSRDVFLVLGGRGVVEITDGGAAPRTIEVRGAPTLYELATHTPDERVLRLRATPGVEAYAFTFG
jgi:thiol-disulfide isomerase/thioredoxin